MKFFAGWNYYSMKLVYRWIDGVQKRIDDVHT